MLATVVLLASLVFAVVTVAGRGTPTSPESGEAAHPSGGAVVESSEPLDETRRPTDPLGSQEPDASPEASMAAGPEPSATKSAPEGSPAGSTRTPRESAPLASESISPGAATADPAATASPVAVLVIQGPEDGEVVAFDVATVYGSAPPNARIVRDVPLWFDQHAIANPDGSWVMQVPLSQGLNVLTFRLGDDRSTEQTIRITYPGTP